MSIPIDSSYMNSYYVFSYNDKTGKLTGFNSDRQKLDYFDLLSRNALGSTKLEKEGPDGVNEVSGLHFQSQDSIFVQDGLFLKLIDSKGKVKSKFDITENAKKVLGRPIVNQYVRLYYNSNRKSFIYFLTLENPKKIDQPIFAEYRIENRTLNVLPISFSEYFLKNDGKMGFLSYANATIVEDNQLIYNYLFSNDIFSYDLKNHNTVKSKSESSITKSIASPLLPTAGGDLEKWQIHAIENPYFFQMIYDKNKKLFYQFSWQEIPYEKKDNTFVSFVDKPLVLSVFDENLVLLHEEKLPKNTYMPFSWFVTNDGLFVSNQHPKNPSLNEDRLSFHVIRITR